LNELLGTTPRLIDETASQFSQQRNELRHKLEGGSRVTAHVARHIAVLGLELCANTHLQGRDSSLKPRSAPRNPMLPVIEEISHFHDVRE
jgi:tRNA(Ile)-lysidine synthase TilS/MesJ